MRAVVQRVDRASVTVNSRVTGKISQGIHILLGVRSGDTKKDAEWLADKCVNLRIFDDEDGKFNYSCLDIRGEVLVVSQFTLYGDCRRGRRPSFTDAAEPEKAEALYDYFVDQLKSKGLTVATGIFAARMQCEIINEGPVTLIVDTEDVFG
ncbi:D-tyrosyl-tRNA(Tyr) deacylase [bacterium]|nr:D-tyrosyl-tRNA(Tyr) deacylase [bacterium]